MSRPTANDVHVPGLMNQRRKKPVQKPWTAGSVPDNLKEWPQEMRAKFAEVANAVLEEGGGEAEAIQAGIAAAMRLKKGYRWLAKDRNYDGAMIAFFIPESIANQLAIPGGLRPEELHITLAYLGEANQIPDIGALQKYVESFAATHLPLRVKVGGIGRFNHSSEGKQPFYASADSPELPAFRQALVEGLKVKAKIPFDTEHGFTPHITLKYIKEDGRIPNVDLPETEFICDTLSLAIGNVRFDYPMKGVQMKEKSDLEKAEILMTNLILAEQESYLEFPGPKNWVRKSNHSYSKCMVCKENSPDQDTLWQDSDGGLHRAWMCAKCFPDWYAEKGQMVIHTHGIEGAASKRYKPIRHSPKEGKRKMSKDSRFKVNGQLVTVEAMAKAWLAGQPVAQPAVESGGPDVIEKAWDFEPISKDKKRQVVYGLILRPNKADSQRDKIDSEEIMTAAHTYMAKQAGAADLLHQKEIPRNKAVLVESFIMGTDVSEWHGQSVTLKRGDWVGAMWIPDAEIWKGVESGEIEAFSIRGVGRRIPA